METQLSIIVPPNTPGAVYDVRTSVHLFQVFHRMIIGKRQQIDCGIIWSHQCRFQAKLGCLLPYFISIFTFPFAAANNFEWLLLCPWIWRSLNLDPTTVDKAAMAASTRAISSVLLMLNSVKSTCSNLTYHSSNAFSTCVSFTLLFPVLYMERKLKLQTQILSGADMSLHCGQEKQDWQVVGPD